MSILCALVAYGTKILTEHTIDTTKNFSRASSTILSKIPPNDSRLTYAADDYLFHYIKTHDVVFMCMSEESLGRKIPFTFLNDLQAKFFNQFSRSDLPSTPPYGLTTFNPELVSLLTSYNLKASDPSDQQGQQGSTSNQQINVARSELANVKDIMIKNVGEILNRGERIELLLDKTDNLSAQSSAFRKRSQVLRRKMWWKNTRMIALSALVVVMVIYILLAQACGANLSHCSS
ncbi:hypothetical protein MJO28_015904 [Puccinia striiformis f. sp. tritici]|nr:hypothetical protein Pst134EA_029057 [Puccinia striiformis f. sp. tritici]KAI9617194.1 hypothetical protein H4Q26_013059 [Puccinia striiformis f. sp. tritici PST-130]KNE90496.1 hypothetical protein PSTG_16060 [Puccinia striiformis f. sp. tritici PST-78]POW08947.1 hypothetical protein PSHT_09353 [Puccinia striiformis]KAH9441116.1 hypothetical protein Pst134EB_029764 [Puccinia striiformis f. sp. tritici]KAH9447072.1 hypothetical protein Pst134EA_029057 [Puccinia striiformis f. sp. tritici]